MLAVHWTPVNNTKAILKNGITKSKKGLFCFPLTGHKVLDRWWIYFFNQYGVRERKRYNGIVFRLNQQDMPAYFGSWVCATNRDSFEKEIKDLKMLGIEFRQIILFRLGEEIAINTNLNSRIADSNEIDKLYFNLAESEVKKSPKISIEKMRDLNFMNYAFEDYQIVLSQSISSDRIIKVLPQGNEFGKVIKAQKVNKINSCLVNP